MEQRVTNAAGKKLALRGKFGQFGESLRPNSSGKHPNIYWDKTKGNWKVFFRRRPDIINVGRFQTFEEAVVARTNALKGLEKVLH